MIELTKNIFGPLHLGPDNLVGVFGPRNIKGMGLSDDEIAHRIRNPMGTPPLRQLAKEKKNVLIVTDDNTRLTPLARIIPPILQELEIAGIGPGDISILIGLGTHRPISTTEITSKFGEAIAGTYRIVNHDWESPDELLSLGPTELGFEVIINKLVQEADLILSVGNIIPHATAGFSGGGKTIMPGICGEKTIEDTHWAALDYAMAEILGNPDNRVRQAILSVCRKVALSMIVNAVLFNGDRVYDLVAGDVDIAHRKGIEASRDIYGVTIPEKADIVIAEAYPTDIDLRQAIKAVCSADLVCKDGGVIILPAECLEGVAPQFPAFTRYGFEDPDGLYQHVESGEFKDKLLAYTLVAIGRIISKRVKAILVSPGVSKEATEHMGFIWAENLQQAYDLAKALVGTNASVVVLKQAGEVLPIVSKG